MNRKGSFKRRKIGGDPKYNSEIVHLLINVLMKGGKKELSARIVYNVLTRLEEYYQDNEKLNKGDKIVAKSVEKLSTGFILRKRKVASRTYQLPKECSKRSDISLSISWIKYGSQKQDCKTYEDKLYKEFVCILDKESGEAMKLRENHMKIAFENQAFSHFA